MSTVRVAIITGKGFQDEEVVYPYYRCLEAGWHTDIVTPGGETVLGKYGVPARATVASEDLDASNYDLVILPGGFEAPDRVRFLPEVKVFVAAMDEAGKLVAAICHGPWIAISAGIVKGRKMTAYWSIEADMINAGADYQHKADVVVDGNIISSPHYNQNGLFMREVVAWVERNH